MNSSWLSERGLPVQVAVPSLLWPAHWWVKLQMSQQNTRTYGCFAEGLCVISSGCKCTWETFRTHFDEAMRSIYVYVCVLSCITCTCAVRSQFSTVTCHCVGICYWLFKPMSVRVPHSDRWLASWRSATGSLVTSMPKWENCCQSSTRLHETWFLSSTLMPERLRSTWCVCVFLRKWQRTSILSRTRGGDAFPRQTLVKHMVSHHIKPAWII